MTAYTFGSGQSTSTLVLSSGDTVLVFSGGTTTGTRVLSGGRETVVDGGTISATAVSSGGSEIVAGSGVALTTTISSGGGQIVENTGASGTIVLAGGTEEVAFSGSVASNTVVDSGGYLLLMNSGSEVGADVRSGGAIVVVPGGGTVTGGTIEPGGAVISTGVILLGLGAPAVVISAVASGTVSGATVSGLSYVLSGGTLAAANLVGTGASVQVSGGGIVTGTTVSSGAAVVAQVGGAISGGSVLSFGNEQTTGGSATNVTVNGGTFVAAGVLDIGTTVLAGTDDISDAASNTVVTGGAAFVQAGGSAIGGSVGGNGAFVVEAGATASGVTVSAGGTQTVFGGYAGSAAGAASGTVVKAGGFVLVNSGGILGAADIQSGGTAILLPGAVPSGPTVEPGGTVLTAGVYISSGYQVLSASGPVLSGAVISNVETVLPGGTDLNGILTSAQIVLSGGVASGTTIKGFQAFQTVNPGGSAVNDTVTSGGFELIDPTATAIGTIVNSAGSAGLLSGGTLSNASIGAAGTVNVAAGAQLVNATISSGGRAVISAATAATGTTLLSGGTLALAFLTPVSGGMASLNTVTDVVTITEGVTSTTEQLGGNLAGMFAHVAADIFGAGTALTVNGTPCYCPGTLILTDQGEIPVERLGLGDRVVTRGGSAAPIRWIGRRCYAGRFIEGRRDILPVRIHPGALGGGLPRRDLFVSPLHAMLLDGVLVPAGLLVNGVSVTQAHTADAVHYIHVELDNHDILLAEGAPSESFVDDNSRAMFQNAHEHAALFPDHKRVPAIYCAPRVEDGEALDRIKRAIDLRAGLPVPGVGEPLRGYLDGWEGHVLHGWAQNPDRTAVPVCLDVLVDGVPVARTLANRYRADLQSAGLGDGSHGFQVELPHALGRAIEVRRTLDGTVLGTIAEGTVLAA